MPSAAVTRPGVPTGRAAPAPPCDPENAFAKASESAGGVDWGSLLPIPEVEKLTDKGLQSVQYTFSADNRTEADTLYRGASPSGDGTELTTGFMPGGGEEEIRTADRPTI